MFSVMMIPKSTITPMAMAMPARLMMFAPTPNRCITRNVKSIPSGRLTATARLARTCNRKSTTTMMVVITASISVAVTVAVVSRMRWERS